MPESTVPLVYVFIGDTLPDYVTPSLRLTRRFFRGDMVLLTNAKNIPSVKGVVVEDFSSWYQPELFSRFVEKTPLDPVFRGGFWLVTAERFFVLAQYMSARKVPKLFHAELDNIVFNLADVSDALDQIGPGIFYPTDTSGRGLGSLVYCNDVTGMNGLTAFMADNSHLGNEMTILGAFVHNQPSVARALPSEPPDHEISEESGAGIFDAAAIGQWLFGLDPANTVYSTYNKASNPSSVSDLSTLRFSLSAKKGTLYGHTHSSRQWRIHNLHVHSKIFSRLALPGILRAYLFGNRLPFVLPVVIQPGHWRNRLVKFLLNRGNHSPLRWFLRNFVGRKTLRFLLSSSRVPLSNSQLERLYALLPAINPQGDHLVPARTALLHIEQSQPSQSISYALWLSSAMVVSDSESNPWPPSDTQEFDEPLEALLYLLALDCEAVMLVDSGPLASGPDGVTLKKKQVLWPDTVKPQWEPHFELPIFPERSRAVTFTTTPQVLSLARLREIFAEDRVADRWAKQVRPDTFQAALINVYAQHMLINRRSEVLLAAKPTEIPQPGMPGA